MKKPLNPTLRIVIVSLAIVVGAIRNAPAAIIYYNPADLTVAWLDVPPVLTINVLGGQAASGFLPTHDLRVGFSTAEDLYFAAPSDGILSAGSTTAFLWPGNPVTAGGTYIEVPIASESVWDVFSTGYMGYRLDAGGGNYNYGWAQFTYNDVANSITLLDYAYESTVNTSILAGQGPIATVPEPTAAGLWLVGGFLCCRYGRWRRTNALNQKED